MPATKHGPKLHPMLARVAGVPVPDGMSWQLVHCVFIPCEDQIHGDGDPDTETVALMPSLAAPQATVAGVGATGSTLVNTPTYACETCAQSGTLSAGSRVRVITDPGGPRVQVSATTGNLPAANWWISSGLGVVQWDGMPGRRDAQGNLGPVPIGATRAGHQEIWNGSVWIPNRPGALGIVRGQTRNAGNETWTGDYWEITPGMETVIQPAQITIGTTRNGGRDVWDGRAWARNPAWAPYSIGETRYGGREVWAGRKWVRNPAFARRVAPQKPMTTTVALNLAGLIAGGSAPPPANNADLSASEILALAAAGGPAADQDAEDGDDLLSLLGADGGGTDEEEVYESGDPRAYERQEDEHHDEWPESETPGSSVPRAAVPGGAAAMASAARAGAASAAAGSRLR